MAGDWQWPERWRGEVCVVRATALGRSPERYFRSCSYSHRALPWRGHSTRRLVLMLGRRLCYRTLIPQHTYEETPGDRYGWTRYECRGCGAVVYGFTTLIGGTGRDSL